MASTTTEVEEILRKDLTVPQICLKIINLNINERGESLTPPPRDYIQHDSAIQRCGALPLPRRRIHKLRSYDHLVRDIPLIRDNKLPGLPHAGGRDHGLLAKVNYNPFHDDSSMYLFFVKGMNNVMNGDKEQMLKTILELLSEQAVTVAKSDPVLMSDETSSTRDNQVNQVALHCALLGLNELLDPGVFDISRSGMVGVGQCITFTLYFQEHLAHLGRHVYHSSYVQVLRDAWMGFGCIGAMAIMSSMRQ